MWRFIAGVVSALLLTTAGFLVWRAQADRGTALPQAPAAASTADAPLGIADLAGPPTATERTREEKRFQRYDRDRNGAVSRDEYMASRRKAFAKLDLNGDGRLSFDEYAVKTVTKFAVADRDRNTALNPIEFATTRVIRRARALPKCPPTLRAPAPPQAEEPDAEG